MRGTDVVRERLVSSGFGGRSTSLRPQSCRRSRRSELIAASPSGGAAFPDAGDPQVQLSRSTWCQIETAIVNFFRAEGGEILADSGESYLVVNDERKISLSDLARNLMDPAS